jgi:hypothetical protein
VFFHWQFFVFASGKMRFRPRKRKWCVERVTVGLPFCELCENVNNFSGKFLPATAIREKTLSSSTLTGSRARKMIVSILPAA